MTCMCFAIDVIKIIYHLFNSENFENRLSSLNNVSVTFVGYGVRVCLVVVMGFRNLLPFTGFTVEFKFRQVFVQTVFKSPYYVVHPS